MTDVLKLNLEQKRIVSNLHSPDEATIIDTLYNIREVGGEYCIAPMIDVFFTTPFADVRKEIGRVFLDLKSAKVSEEILKSLSAYMSHEYIAEFISNLWQSAVVFDDVTLFVEKFVEADDMLALDCLSLVENNLGNLSQESVERCREIVNSNYSNFSDMKKQLADDMISIFDSNNDDLM